jgi:NAD+ kinase
LSHKGLQAVKSVAIVANPKSANIGQMVHEVIDFLKRFRIDVLLEKRTSEAIKVNWHSSHEDIRNKADFVIVLGGDGTVLSAARIVGECEIPILCVHMGNLGFITVFSQDELFEALESAMNKRLPTHRRMRLECEIINSEGFLVYKEHALNEVTLNKGGIARMIDFDVFAGYERVSSYRADGFIVSTPTGSTGYSLSAGGPIVVPSMQLIVLSPICSHSVNSRALIVPSDTVVRIKLTEARHDIFVSQDGQVGRYLHAGEYLVIRKTPFDTLLYYIPPHNFYDRMRDGFGWGTPPC